MFPPTTKVMVCDDFKTMRKLVINALAQVGIKDVTEAEDAADAVVMVEKAAAEGKPFGLIVSDWNMPKMQGIEFLKRVRENPATKTTPFLMVTAEAESKNILEAVKLGVSNYVVKPFSPSTFAEKLLAVFKKHNP
ncbi:MAG: response regulator [Bdellovibrionales bacterium]|nr:response regulator [Bdellovibrionales bacterium]